MAPLGRNILNRCQSDPTTLRDCDCYRIAAELGRLAPWVLRDEVLHRAADFWENLGHSRQARWLRTPPRLRREPGSCGVLLAVTRPDEYPLLRPAFALPVRWLEDRGPAAGPELPATLAAEAERVLQLAEEFRAGGPPATGAWQLRLALDDPPENYDLSDWREVGGGSWWGSLTAAWLVAARGGRPDPSVWASVGWDRGLRPVEGLQAKADAARHYGATRLFVGSDQPDRETIPGLEVVPLDDRWGHPLHALRPLTQSLAVRPSSWQDYLTREESGAAEERRRDFFRDSQAYYSLLKDDLGQTQAASAFYQQQLLPVIAEQCRRQLPQGWDGRPWRLITVASANPELVELVTRLVRPTRLLVLYTPTTETRWRSGRARLASLDLACQIEDLEVPDHLRPGGLPPQAIAFARDGDPADLVLDLTPGTKLMTLALDRDLAQPGCVRLYLRTDWSGREMTYGTEQVVLLD